jgi:hypothetical protein
MTALHVKMEKKFKDHLVYPAKVMKLLLIQNAQNVKGKEESSSTTYVNAQPQKTLNPIQIALAKKIFMVQKLLHTNKVVTKQQMIAKLQMKLD